MQKLILLILFILPLASVAQDYSFKSVERQAEAIKAEISFQDLPEVSAELKKHETANAPFKRLDAEKTKIAAKKTGAVGKSAFAKSGTLPKITQGFVGQVPNGTPLDNSIAISAQGQIISAVNTTIRVYDTLGNSLYARSLAAIANQLGNLNRPFDPHVMYDAEADKFILVFLNGSDHTNTNIVVGFSQTNDAAGKWNFYLLPGNITTEEYWSDYPFIGISENELFITVLLWKDGDSGWDSDAYDENIWQINKQDGYEGKPLRQKVYHELQYGGRHFWNIRPVTGAAVYGPEFYLLTNRPKDLQNDTVFLIKITGELTDPNAKVEIKAVRADEPYGLQPNSAQKGAKKLRTNYCDIHSAYFLRNEIFFVGNSIYTNSGRPGIYIGRMKDLEGNTSLDATLVGYDTLDLNYPSIAYAGGGPGDASAMILCLHVNENIYPGSSVIMLDRSGTPSEAVRIKEGLGPMDILFGDSLERWGDYTGIHPRTNIPGEVWMAGSFGLSNNSSQTWIAKAINTDPSLALPFVPQQNRISVYPNPSRSFNISLKELPAGEYSFEVLEINGKTVWKQKSKLSAGDFTVKMHLDNVSQGNYKLVISDVNQNIVVATDVMVVD